MALIHVRQEGGVVAIVDVPNEIAIEKTMDENGGQMHALLSIAGMVNPETYHTLFTGEIMMVRPEGSEVLLNHVPEDAAINFLQTTIVQVVAGNMRQDGKG